VAIEGKLLTDLRDESGCGSCIVSRRGNRRKRRDDRRERRNGAQPGRRSLRLRRAVELVETERDRAGGIGVFS